MACSSAASTYRECGRLASAVPQRAPRRSRPVQQRATGGGEGASIEGAQLASQFASFLNAAGLHDAARPPRPSHLMTPTAAIAAQLDSLQRNDWPDTDAGIAAAWAFALPADAEALTPAEAGGAGGRVRSWAAEERWLTFAEFAALLRQPPYSAMVGCDSWRPISRLQFPSTRYGHRAVQAVEVVAPRRRPPAPAPPGGGAGADADVAAAQREAAQQWGQHAGGSAPWLWQGSGGGGGGEGGEGADAGGEPDLRPYTFTFCLQRVAAGPYRDCWLTVGVRQGNYSC